MAHGFVKGSLIGGACGVFGLAALSLASAPPRPPSVAIDAPEVVRVVQETIAPEPVQPAVDTAPVALREAPPASAPALDGLDALRAEDTEAASQPRVGAATGPVATMTTSASVPSAAVAEASAPVRAPALRSVSTLDAPDPDGAVFMAPAPERLPAPGGGARPVADAGANTRPEVPLPPASAFNAPVPPVEPTGPDRLGFVDRGAAAAGGIPVSEPAAPLAGQDGRSGGVPSMPEDTAAAQALRDKEPAAADRAATVLVNRLPTLAPAGDVPPAKSLSALDAPQTDAETAAADPVVRFASKKLHDADGPLMAVVLLDQGRALSDDSVGPSALRDFPYPVSVAVDASLADAGERMQAYRDAGLEVLAAVDFPEGALAQDAQVVLDIALSRLPEALAVLEGTGAGVQTTIGATRHVAAFLADSGHGLVVQNGGLNSAQKLAARAGVPTAVVFRDVDDNGQSSDVIRRSLDQAALRARQEGGVVMLGRLQPGTIAALRLWLAQDRAAQVTLVPVSNLLVPAAR